MAVGLGLNTWLAFGEESTYGTAVARTKFLEILGSDIEFKQTLISKPALRQISQLNKVQSKKDIAGPFKFQMPFEGAEKILKHAWGTVAAVTGSGPYVHAYTLTAALQTGLTIEVNKDATAIGGSTAFLYEGCQINKMTLTQEMEDIALCECDILGEDFSQVAQTSASFSAINPLTWDMFTLTLNGGSVAVRGFELTIENGLAADRFKLGSRIRKGLGRAQSRKISGKLTFEYEQNTEFALYLNQTTLVSLVATWNNGLGGANQKILAITLPKVAIQGSDVKVSDQGPLMLEIPFEAYQNAAAHDELTASLTNNTNTSQ